MEPMRSHSHGVKGALLKGSSCVWCGEWTVLCSLSTRPVDSRLSKQTFFFFGFGVGIQSEEFPIVHRGRAIGGILGIGGGHPSQGEL
jgi:hypothetical protein